MDLELIKLIDNVQYYRKLAHVNNPFVFKQEDYDKWKYYRQKLKEYCDKKETKIEIKYKPIAFTPMSDWSEEFEHTKI